MHVHVPMGGHNVTVKNTITSWQMKSITSTNPLNLGPRFIQMLDDFHLIHLEDGHSTSGPQSKTCHENALKHKGLVPQWAFGLLGFFQKCLCVTELSGIFACNHVINNL